jgi:2-polyprenyl-3-methyl-5-hydroxy-6-metoxy-1,4-benzoquinol methylase
MQTNFNQEPVKTIPSILRDIKCFKTAFDTENIDHSVVEPFDFAMSIGVLHHIPNTQKAMNNCVKKVKLGGYF